MTRTPEQAARNAARSRERYATDPEYRRRAKEADRRYRERMRDDPEYRARKARTQRDLRARRTAVRLAVMFQGKA